ncbi:MAG: DsrE family protein [Rhodospirillaceae bacterium]
MTEPAQATGAKPQKPALAVTLLSGCYERVHFALSLAAAAAALDRPVVLFFTMGGCETLRAPNLAGDQTEAVPGWQGLWTEDPSLRDARSTDQQFQDQGLPGLETLLSALSALGARFLLCEAGLRARKMTQDNLRQDITLEVTGLVTFLMETDGFERAQIT